MKPTRLGQAQVTPNPVYLIKLKIRDICHGDRVAARAIILQQTIARPVRARQYARMVHKWVQQIGLDPSA